MYKTKLGISVGLMGALFCILGLVSGLSWVILGITAYILLREENEWLRRLSIKVLLVLAFVAFVPHLFLCVEYIFNIVNVMADDVVLEWPLNIKSLVLNAVNFLGDGIIILMALKAFKQGHFAVKPLDNMISKNV